MWIKTCSFAGCFFDGASRNRTGDLLLAKQALSHLSYGPFGARFYGPLRCVAGEARETIDRLPTAAAITRKANAVSSCVDRRCFVAW